MTLFQQLQHIVPLGYIVTFQNEMLNLKISIEKYSDGDYYSRESWLPLSDHFYESKLVDCIEFMIAEIKKEM